MGMWLTICMHIPFARRCTASLRRLAVAVFRADEGNNSRHHLYPWRCVWTKEARGPADGWDGNRLGPSVENLPPLIFTPSSRLRHSIGRRSRHGSRGWEMPRAIIPEAGR